MGVYAGPEVVESGLVLALDAGNTKSYPGSGTTWTDLSGRSGITTLTNGPTYDSSNGGNIVFDGTNDYVDFFAPNLGTTTTVEMWCKISSTTERMFFGWLNYNAYCRDGNMGFNTFNGDVYGISSTTVTNLGLLNNWKHYVFEMRSDVSYTNNKIYINASLQTLSQQRNSENVSNRNFNSGNGRIAITGSTLSTYFMPMNCASFKIYNRALTASEIQQNFNATRSRFGV